MTELSLIIWNKISSERMANFLNKYKLDFKVTLIGITILLFGQLEAQVSWKTDFKLDVKLLTAVLNVIEVGSYRWKIVSSRFLLLDFHTSEDLE